MIENMRKYTGLMVVVLILLAAGLIITMKPGGSGGGIGTKFMNVNGVTLDRQDFAKEGKNSISAIQRLRMTQNFQDFFKLAGFIQTLSADATTETQSYINFVTNRILLKQKAQKLGLYSSKEVAAKYIEDSMFKGPDGSFNAKTYTDYISSLSSLGLKESDFQQIVAEYIVFEKTRDLIGGGLTPSSTEVLTVMKSEQQTIGLSSVSFKLDDFKKDLAPTEEEIKAFWETHKDRYKTDRQLKITYALTLLDDSDMPKQPTPAADADPAAASQQNIAYQEKLATWTEQRKAQTKILTSIFSDFSDSIEDGEYKNFEAAAAKAKETAGEDLVVATTEAFTASSVPEILKGLTLKHAAPGTTLADALFAIKVQNDLRFDTTTYSVGRDGHIAVRIDEEIKPMVKSYEDAKALAQADLITKISTEAMTAAAEKAQAALQQLVTAGKSFTEAAQEKKLTATAHKPFTNATPPADTPNATDLFRIAQITNPGTIAEEISYSDDSASIIFVDSRTYEVTGDNALKETQALDRASNQLKYITFNTWISELKNGADLQLPEAN